MARTSIGLVRPGKSGARITDATKNTWRNCNTASPTRAVSPGNVITFSAFIDTATNTRPVSVAAASACTDRNELQSAIGRLPGPWPGFSIYSFFLPDFFARAQRLRIASAIRFLAAADMIQRFGVVGAGVDLFALPGGRPRRLATVLAPTPSKACIAASTLLRSSLSCWTISLTFIEVS